MSYFASFLGYSLRNVQYRYIWLSLLRLSPRRRGSPRTVFVKFLQKGTKWRRNIAEDINRLSRSHECYRQTTDDRRTDSSI